MKIKTLSAGLLLIAMAAMYSGCTQPQQKAETPEVTNGDGMDRTTLPIKEPARLTSKELDARNATAPARFEVKAPEGAPNVLVVLIDDMGFGVTETFGGPVTTPTMDKLANKIGRASCRERV